MEIIELIVDVIGCLKHKTDFPLSFFEIPRFANSHEFVHLAIKKYHKAE